MQICLSGLLSGLMTSSRGEKWPTGRRPGHFSGSKGRTLGGPQGRRAGFRGQMQICLLGLLSGLAESSRGEQWPAGREPRHLSGSKGRTRGGPQGRRTGFRGQMQICLLGLLSGLMGSTGCAPANPPRPKGSNRGARNACDGSWENTCKPIDFEPLNHHFVRNAKGGMSVFPRELSRQVPRSPHGGPLTYMQIYNTLAHMVLRNHVFPRADQNSPCLQPPGDPRRSPAPPGGPPGTPPRPGLQAARENMWFSPHEAALSR